MFLKKISESCACRSQGQMKIVCVLRTVQNYAPLFSEKLKPILRFGRPCIVV